jgi:hypothetical protein
VLSGRVIASENEEAVGLGDAVVTATREGSAFTTVTDAEGDFAFGDLAAGEWILYISREGYLDKSQAVHVGSEDAVTVAIDPKPAEEPMEGMLLARTPAVKTR